MADFDIVEQLLVQMLQLLYKHMVVLQLSGVLLLAALSDHGFVRHRLLDPADKPTAVIEL